MKHLPMSEMSEVMKELEAERQRAPLGKCAVCESEDVPVLTLTNCDDPARTMTVCIDCMTGKTPMKMEPGQAN